MQPKVIPQLTNNMTREPDLISADKLSISGRINLA